MPTGTPSPVRRYPAATKPASSADNQSSKISAVNRRAVSLVDTLRHPAVATMAAGNLVIYVIGIVA